MNIALPGKTPEMVQEALSGSAELRHKNWTRHVVWDVFVFTWYLTNKFKRKKQTQAFPSTLYFASFKQLFSLFSQLVR